MNFYLKIKSFLKRNFENLEKDNEMEIFGIQNDNLLVDPSEPTEDRPIMDYFVRFKNEDKKKTKNYIFLFHHLVFIIEKQFLKKNKKIFKNLYENFYSKYKSLNYESEKNYNLQGIEFFEVKIKVKVKNKTLKRKW